MLRTAEDSNVMRVMFQVYRISTQQAFLIAFFDGLMRAGGWQQQLTDNDTSTATLLQMRS
jgi:hypothetical protein